MFFLTLWTNIKKWVVLLTGLIILFLSTYVFGLLKGRKQIEEKEATKDAEQEKAAQEEAAMVYQKAEDSAKNVPAPITPNVEKRDDLDTTN